MLGVQNGASGTPDAAIWPLRDMGHNVRVVKNGVMFGGYQAIMWNR